MIIKGCNMSDLSLRHIYKVYPARSGEKKRLFKKKQENVERAKNFVAVQDFDMDIKDGEFIVFVGPSGCGKSTTLRMIAGLEDISAGELYIDGKLVNNVEPKDRNIAMVFQSYALYPHMTAFDNIAFGLKMRKVSVPLYDVCAKEKAEISVLEEEIRLLKSEKSEESLKAISEKKAAIAELKVAVKEKTAEISVKIAELKTAIKEKAENVSGDGDAEAERKELEERLAELERGEPLLLIDSAKINDVMKKLKGVNASLSAEGVEGEIKEGLLSRKATLEKELEYYRTTPVQAYSYKHMPKAEIDEKVKWAANILGVEELLYNKPKAMSGGQRQRIALGRAIVREPKVMLLDEPLSNLDAKLRTSMRSEIVKLHNQLKTTFIYVTHDQVEAMTMGTRIVVMKLGVVQQIDTPVNLFDYPANKFVAGFIGTPQMNFFDVVIKKSGKSLKVDFDCGYSGTYPLSALRKIDPAYLDGQPHDCVLGVRGENIAVGEKGLPATINITEVLGNTTHLFVKTRDDGPDYVVCLSARGSFAVGDKINLSFAPEQIHLFDRETELSIIMREESVNAQENKTAEK